MKTTGEGKKNGKAKGDKRTLPRGIFERNGVLYVRYFRDGQKHVESTKSNKVEVAKRLLDKRRVERAEGRIPGSQFNKVRFEDLKKTLIADYERRGRKSLDRAELSLKHLEGFFQGYRVPRITTPEIERYIEHRKAEGAKGGTINRELSALLRMLNLAARETPPRVDATRMPNISALKQKEGGPRAGFFEHGDFLKLRGALPEYLRGFVTFAYRSGWRKREITGLTWSRVDLERGVAWLDKGMSKNDEGRTLVLDAELKDVLQRQWQKRIDTGSLLPWVFPNFKNDGQIKYFNVSWHTACENTGLQGKVLHDFRRSCVRNLVRAGVPEKICMRVTGHKTRSVFDRYDIIQTSDLEMAAELQAAYLKRVEAKGKGKNKSDTKSDTVTSITSKRVSESKR